jgi:DNA repair protein REV1
MGSRLEKNSALVRKRIEAHTFEGEGGNEYGSSKFGGFEDYFRRKKIKLQNLDEEIRSTSDEHPPIFRGIVAHVNGYTQPSLNDLHRIIVSYGGGFLQYLDNKTSATHIICSNLTPKKAVEFRQYRIVKPAWVVDSVKAGKLLPWDAYRVVDEGVKQRVLGFNEGNVVSQANTPQRSYRGQTNTSWYTSQVKHVADGVENENGAHFSHPQSPVLDGTTERRGPAAAPVWNSIEGYEKHSEIPRSSGSFEVTSSLENALVEAAQSTPPLSAESLLLDNPHQIESLLEKTLESPSPCITLTTSRVSTPTKPTHELESPTPTNSMLSTPVERVHKLESPSPSEKPRVLTAEEHNAILLADPHIRKSTTANPDFIKQYYSESRLHHLSTWKADLKAKFQMMAAEKSSSQKPAKRKPGSRRYIMHVDFDCFFCAVSLRNTPEYVDKPAVVAHGSGPGSEIASCNYPARAFGVKNGMWMKNALKLCPNIKVLPYDFPAYEVASAGFYEAIIDVGGIVQSVSVDEALVDITAICLQASESDGVGIHEGSIWREQEKADEVAGKLRRVIMEKTGCAVSIGVGGNILLAKVALRKAKPAGQYQIKPEEVLDFIGELTVQHLPGIAYNIGGKLEDAGVKFVKDLRLLTKDRLMTLLGPKTGEKLWEYSRGIDKAEVGEQVVRKSVSAEVNWGIRFISQQEAEEFVQNLCLELQRRLIDQKVKGTQLTMKIMNKAANAPMDPPKNLGHGLCDTYNKSVTLGVATNSAEITGREAVSILRSYGFSPGELRGLGVQMTKLEPVKSGSNGGNNGGQCRINFGKSAVPKTSPAYKDPIDDPRTPKKIRFSSPKPNDVEDPIDDSITPQKPKPKPGRLVPYSDPIDEINSPQKTTKSTPIHPAAAILKANLSDQSAKKLNLTGTQFILPSQIDLSVLAELPQDIRSKLMAQSNARPTSRAQSPIFKSRSHSPATRLELNPRTIPSQFDPEVFAALPDDVKAEVLANYPAPEPKATTPRKPKAATPTKKWTPTKRRGRPAGSKNKKEDPYPAFMQSSFIAPPKADDFPVADADDTLDPDFLSALPEEMRAEVIAEHRRAQLAKRGALATAVTQKRRRPPELAQVGSHRLHLPAREPKPTFTTKELTTLEELRTTLNTWYQEFREDGPYPEDVAAIERYLRRVVIEEKDMAKVVGVVKWIAWLVDDNNDENGSRIWQESVESIKEKVQSAVRERGLGRLDL